MFGIMMDAAAQQQAAEAHQQQAVDAATVAACARRYRSYDPASGTYIGRDGQPRPCPAQ